MTVAVLGLWHLGPVTAACLAAAGHLVTAWDPDAAVVEGLTDGRVPVDEPGLAEQLASAHAAGRLMFVERLDEAVAGADVVWITFDTPVDEDDRPDVEFVVRHVTLALPHVADEAIVVVSSQLPVGTVAHLEQAWQDAATGRRAVFACVPENLRLGTAIRSFTAPDRVVVGVRRDEDRARMAALLAPVTQAPIEWMGVESAEMTKHAINAFLATSVSFINEIAAVCEQMGADAREVERGLRSEARIGPRAYLGPGAAFAGGTLARDVATLRALGRQVGRATPLMDGVAASNREHEGWARRCLAEHLGALTGRTVAVWGLTYKPGTSTLRRSPAVDLCRWLLAEGARVRAHDPAAEPLPAELAAVTRVTSAVDTATGADALVVATTWPEYRSVSPDDVAGALGGHLIVDANAFLARTLGADSRFRFVSVGVSGAGTVPRPGTPAGPEV